MKRYRKKIGAACIEESPGETGAPARTHYLTPAAREAAAFVFFFGLRVIPYYMKTDDTTPPPSQKKEPPGPEHLLLHKVLTRYLRPRAVSAHADTTPHPTD